MVISTSLRTNSSGKEVLDLSARESSGRRYVSYTNIFDNMYTVNSLNNTSFFLSGCLKQHVQLTTLYKEGYQHRYEGKGLWCSSAVQLLST